MDLIPSVSAPTSRFICKVCTECFASRDLLQDHLTTTGHRRSPTKHKMKFQENSTIQPIQLVPLDPLRPSESKSTKSPSTKRLICFVCLKQFERKHELFHHLESESHFKCRICSQCFQTKKDLDSHVHNEKFHDAPVATDAPLLQILPALRPVTPRSLTTDIEQTKKQVIAHDMLRPLSPRLLHIVNTSSYSPPVSRSASPHPRSLEPLALSTPGPSGISLSQEIQAKPPEGKPSGSTNKNRSKHQKPSSKTKHSVESLASIEDQLKIVERRRDLLKSTGSCYDPSNRQRFIYMDMDNIMTAMYNSHHIHPMIPNASSGRDLQLNYEKFTERVCGNSGPVHVLLATYYGTNEKFARGFQKFGWKVKRQDSTTDTFLQLELLDALVPCTGGSSSVGKDGCPTKTLVLLTGDGNISPNNKSFREVIHKYLLNNWCVEIHSWIHSLHEGYIAFQREYPSHVIVRILDDEHVGQLVHSKVLPSTTVVAVSTQLQTTNQLQSSTSLLDAGRLEPQAQA